MGDTPVLVLFTITFVLGSGGGSMVVTTRPSMNISVIPSTVSQRKL